MSARAAKSKLTSAQRTLKRKHGTPDDFADAVRECLDITHDEETAAIARYRREWATAGRRV